MRAKMVARVLHDLHPGIMTEEIYRHAFEILKQEEKPPVAARYSMKRAVFALAPPDFRSNVFSLKYFAGTVGAYEPMSP